MSREKIIVEPSSRVTGVWHLISAEYPPQFGGVSDYTHQVARGLADAGDEVHVWAPECSLESEMRDQKSKVNSRESEVRAKRLGVTVHRELGRIRPVDLRRVGMMLDRFPAPRRLLVQWVPNGFGMRAMNVPFCIWLWWRACKHDVVEIMAHECYLPFKRWAFKQNVAAIVQRLMTVILLRASRRIWISIPAWEKYWRSLAMGRTVTFSWLPIPSNIPMVDDPKGIGNVHEQLGIKGERVLGHFGTYSQYDKEILKGIVPSLLDGRVDMRVILMGRGSSEMHDELIAARPDLVGKIHATGCLNLERLSLHLSACDVLLQPCQSGVSTRRTTVMACLAHGKPVVTTSGRLTEALWAESRAVALAPDRDVQAIACEAHRLLHDPLERDRLSSTARALYQEKFEIRHVVARLGRSVPLQLDHRIGDSR